LTKSTYLMDYKWVSSEYVTIATQLFSQLPTDAPADPGHPYGERVPPPGADGTLLAIVPIPGTQTSLAIVGYAISTAAAPRHAPAASGKAQDAGPQNEAAPGPAQTGPAQTGPIQDSGGLLIDRVQRRVWTDGGEISVTFQEFELLAFLSAHPAAVFSRADLLQHVWKPSDAPDQRNVQYGSRTVDVHVSRLRRKLGPVYGQCLVTEHRAGYQFRPLAAAVARP
jgi:DNA-binding winged helix-turn-helix (wHTH) protein